MRLPAEAHLSPPEESGRRVTSTTGLLPCPEQEEDEWDREWREYLLTAAFERLASKTDARHFQVFELRVRQHWPVLRISNSLHVNPATIYVIVHRLTKQLRAEVSRLQEQIG